MDNVDMMDAADLIVTKWRLTVSEHLPKAHDT